jgi:hypothetical protein
MQVRARARIDCPQGWRGVLLGALCGRSRLRSRGLQLRRFSDSGAGSLASSTPRVARRQSAASGFYGCRRPGFAWPRRSGRGLRCASPPIRRPTWRGASPRNCTWIVPASPSRAGRPARPTSASCAPTTPVTGRLQRLLELNRRFDVRRGVVISLRGVIGMHAGVALACEGWPGEWAQRGHGLRDEVEPLLHDFNRALLARHARAFAAPLLPPLGSQQRELIRLLAEGHSTESAAQTLRLSIHTSHGEQTHRLAQAHHAYPERAATHRLRAAVGLALNATGARIPAAKLPCTDGELTVHGAALDIPIAASRWQTACVGWGPIARGDICLGIGVGDLVGARLRPCLSRDHSWAVDGSEHQGLADDVHTQ